jgi:hypothetical protein
MTLEDLLRNSGTIDFRVRAKSEPEKVTCYIHPLNKDGRTIDFYVVGNEVTVLDTPGIETFTTQTAEEA